LSPGFAPDPAQLITAIDALVSCQGLSELALAAARIPDRLLLVEAAVVVLRTAEGEFVGRQPEGPSELEKWALGLPAGPLQVSVKNGQNVAAGFETDASGVRGVVAVVLRSADDAEAERRIVEVARLVSTCADQLVGRTRAARALADAQASLGKGLHDLRTPLNSLRLGMHLLGPGLSAQDPAVVQRTHRAVDRMATLVTEMFDALHKN
jgi:signal transduction histidine kinase